MISLKRWGWLLCLCLLLLVIGCSSQDDSWQQVQEAGVLKVGVDPTFPPFELFTGDELVGIDADLAYALGNELGVAVEFVHFGYDGLYDALLTEQADVLISALVIMPERTRDFAYSEPYFNAGEILIVREDEMGIEEMADLNGRSLSVEIGSQGHVQATEWQRKLPALTILPFNTPDDALTAVLQQTADAVLIDHISGRLFLKDNSGLKRIPEPITVEPYAIVVRAEDEQLLDQINSSLEALQSSGKLDQIVGNWLGQ
ncbi:MAG: transporter substrate-binding domain-containing protein [Anaerolineae bacterium]|nr:transporter substrate-binding domain-containing protein [Anaerolineae bacterium]